MTTRISCEYEDIAFIHDNLYRYNMAKNNSPISPDVCAPKDPELSAILLVADNEERLGGAVWRPIDNGRAIFVEYLWISDAARGHGAGAEIVAKLEAMAKKLGCERIDLTTNTFQAPGFYKKRGFTVTSERCEPTAAFPNNIHYSLSKTITQ